MSHALKMTDTKMQEMKSQDIKVQDMILAEKRQTSIEAESIYSRFSRLFLGMSRLTNGLSIKRPKKKTNVVNEKRIKA